METETTVSETPSSSVQPSTTTIVIDPQPSTPEPVQIEPTPIVEPPVEEKKEEEKPKAQKYRDLDEVERDTLFAFYDRYNGNMSKMVLDKDCQFRSYDQIREYCGRYDFSAKFGEIRLQRAKDIVSRLGEGKIKAIENAIKSLETKTVVIAQDEDGKDIFQEEGPSAKELKIAWEIIKVELGEPTTISKGDITTGGKELNTGAKELATAIQELIHDKETNPGNPTVS